MLRVTIGGGGGIDAMLCIVERDPGDVASYDIEMVDGRGTTRARVDLFDRTRGAVELAAAALVAIAEARR
jgi:hypothetical protein